MADAHLPLRSPEKRLYQYAIALFVMLGGLYFFTYNGHSVSGDEEILFDGVHSLALHGNLWLSYMNDDRPVGTYLDNAPVPLVDSEPMQIIAALPLFWLAQLLPGIGLVQTVWLLNILVTALTAVILFYYAVLLGYSTRTAIIGTIVFGVATTAWPYSKVFFREPLLTLCALSSAYCLQRWRLAVVAGNFRFSWLTGSIGSLAVGLATKNSALLFVPALLLIAIPKSWRQLRITRRQTVLLIVGLPLLVAGLTLITQLAAHGRYNIFSFLSGISEVFNDVLYALAGYLLSPGRSLWAFSPVLLLGLWGIARLRRQKRWREIAVPLLILLSISVGYAFLQNRDWYGGTSWGPRYLVPIVPFLSLLILPVIDALPTARLWARLVTAVVVILSVMVQLLGTLIPLSIFYDFLNAETVRLGLPPGTINGWQAGTWDLRYIPFTVLSRLGINGQSDLAWLANNTPVMAMLCVLLIVGGLLVLFRPQFVGMAENQRRRINQLRSGLLSLAFLSVLFVGLYTYRTDPRFGGSDMTLRDGLAALNSRLQPGDAVLLNDRSNRLFFMNYYKSAAPIFTLPDAPGEVVVPGQPPEIVSTNLEASVPPIMSMMLPRIALLATRWWLVTEYIPADTRRTRVTEQYLTRHYFPVQEPYTTSLLRLVEFSAAPAPPDTIPPWPALIRNDDFGNTFTLVGADPAQLSVQRGQALPVSLVWRFDGWPAGKTPFDYSVNVSLIDASGAVVSGAQRSGTPLGTFGATSQWQVGGYYRDNHALLIPANLAPGTYQLWVIWYDWRDGSRLAIKGLDHDPLYTIQVP